MSVLTPIVSMLHSLARQNRQVYFIHGARDTHHNPFSKEINSLASANENVPLEILFSKPFSKDIVGRHYHRKGHFDISVLEECIPGLNAIFLICGPTLFIADIVAQLVARGVGEQYIQTEDFK